MPGVPGHAVSLVSPEDRPLLSAIEKLLKEKINLIVPAQYAGPQPEDLAEDDRREEQNHHQRLSQQSRARRRPAAAPRRSREEASESSEVSAEDSRSDRDSSAPERRGAARRHQVKRSTSRRSPEASSRRGSSDRSDRGDRAERSDRFDPDNFGNSINYTPRRKAPGRSRSRDTIARYEPVDPFAPEHQALFLPQSMPGERPTAQAVPKSAAVLPAAPARTAARTTLNATPATPTATPAAICPRVSLPAAAAVQETANTIQ